MSKAAARRRSPDDLDGYNVSVAASAGAARPLAAPPRAGGLTLTLPPPIASLVEEASRRYGGTPRMLAIEVIEHVFAPGDACLVGAVLDREA